MKRILSILLLIISLVSEAQMLRPQQSILIWSWGESNEPGYGRNYLASAAEKAQRRLRMYQVETNKFDRIHIAAANNWGSFDTTHGYELQLAIALDSGYFGDYNLYITKTGIGSTRIYQWMPSTNNLETAYDRFLSSLDLIETERGVTPTIFCWVNIGINDMFAGMSAASWKDSMDKVIDTLHARQPSMRFILSQFNQSSYTTYNRTIGTIAVERSSYCDTVYDANAELRADDTHWDYEGWKKIGRKVTTIIQQHSMWLPMFAVIRRRKKYKRVI